MGTITKFLASLLDLLIGTASSPLARGVWCRKQRRLLRAGQGTVWVARDAVLWAEWGAARGFFELQRTSGLAYLIAVAAQPGTTSPPMASTGPPRESPSC